MALGGRPGEGDPSHATGPSPHRVGVPWAHDRVTAGLRRPQTLGLSAAAQGGACGVAAAAACTACGCSAGCAGPEAHRHQAAQPGRPDTAPAGACTASRGRQPLPVPYTRPGGQPWRRVRARARNCCPSQGAATPPCPCQQGRHSRRYPVLYVAALPLNAQRQQAPIPCCLSG